MRYAKSSQAESSQRVVMRDLAGKKFMKFRAKILAVFRRGISILIGDKLWAHTKQLIDY